MTKNATYWHLLTNLDIPELKIHRNPKPFWTFSNMIKIVNPFHFQRISTVKSIFSARILALSGFPAFLSNYWQLLTIIDTSSLPVSFRSKKLRMPSQRIEFFSKNAFIWKKKFWNRFGSRGERAKTVRAHNDSSRSGLLSAGPLAGRDKIGRWGEVSARTFLARSPRLLNRF